MLVRMSTVEFLPASCTVRQYVPVFGSKVSSSHLQVARWSESGKYTQMSVTFVVCRETALVGADVFQKFVRQCFDDLRSATTKQDNSLCLLPALMFT